MRNILNRALVSVLVVTPMTAFADDGVSQCIKGADARTIEVLTPGEVGKACDLKYTRDGGRSISVPYHANNNTSFCAAKATELISTLTNDGFSCAALTVAVSDVEEVAQQAGVSEASLPAAVNRDPSAVSVATAEAAALTKATEPVAPISGVSSSQASDEMQNAEESGTTDVSAGSSGITPDDDVVTASLPVPPVQSSGPVDLTAEAVPTARKARRPIASSAGRVVGAAPDPVRVALIEEAEATADAQIPENRTPAEPVKATSPVNASADKTIIRKLMGVRPAATIVEGILGAQVAAWNEGNIEAFMAGYWNNRDLRFVSGTEVTKGWSQTLKRYQKKYAGENMGVLAFEKLDVQMVTDDVAIVVGRFNLERKGDIDSGAFTLVMQQFDGRWRIVHDHTVADAAVISSVE